MPAALATWNGELRIFQANRCCAQQQLQTCPPSSAWDIFWQPADADANKTQTAEAAGKDVDGILW